MSTCLHLVWIWPSTQKDSASIKCYNVTVVLMGWSQLHASPYVLWSFLVKHIKAFSFQLSRSSLFAKHVVPHSLPLPKHVNAWGEMDDSNFHSLSHHFITRKQIEPIWCTYYNRMCSSCSIRMQLEPIKSPLWLLRSQALFMSELGCVIH